MKIKDRASGQKDGQFSLVHDFGSGPDVELGLATAAQALAGVSTSQLIAAKTLNSVISNIYLISFTGKNLAGACTATGTKVGDVILGVAGISTVGQVDGSFEGVVTVVDQIQQSAAADLSTVTYTALIYRPS